MSNEFQLISALVFNISVFWLFFYTCCKGISVAFIHTQNGVNSEKSVKHCSLIMRIDPTALENFIFPYVIQILVSLSKHTYYTRGHIRILHF